MLGKRIVARLQGKTLWACHKCGASLKRNRSCPPRARFCVICGTLYHTYDCGNRMASVFLADIPADCPKVSCIYFIPSPSNVISSRCSSSVVPLRRLSKHEDKTILSPRNAYKQETCLPHTLQHTLRMRFSVVTFVAVCLDLSNAMPTGTERGRKSFGRKSFVRRRRHIGKAPGRNTVRHDATSSLPLRAETCFIRLAAIRPIVSKRDWVQELPFRFSNKLKRSPRCTPLPRKRRLRRNMRVLRRLRKRAKPARRVEWLVC